MLARYPQPPGISPADLASQTARVGWVRETGTGKAGREGPQGPPPGPSRCSSAEPLCAASSRSVPQRQAGRVCCWEHSCGEPPGMLPAAPGRSSRPWTRAQLWGDTKPKATGSALLTVPESESSGPAPTSPTEAGPGQHGKAAWQAESPDVRPQSASPAAPSMPGLRRHGQGPGGFRNRPGPTCRHPKRSPKRTRFGSAGWSAPASHSATSPHPASGINKHDPLPRGRPPPPTWTVCSVCTAWMRW